MGPPRKTRRSRISCLVTGNLQTNCYLIEPADADSGGCALVDPGGSASDIIDAVSAAPSGRLGTVFLTHGHADHCGALPELLERWPGATVFASQVAGEWMADPEANLSLFIGGALEVRPASLRVVGDSDLLQLAGLEFKVLATPGHTPGCCALYAELPEGPVLMAGDVLFAGSVGRTDLPGGSWEVLADSLRSLAALSPDTLVLPGHGPATSIADELARNPYVRQALRS